jgi:hypothetical protein
MIITFILFVIYATVSWRILESYYMLCEPMHCEPMHCEPMLCEPMHCEPMLCENFAKNEDFGRLI